MKILQINAVYGIGSTGKIVRDISDKLIELGHESYVMWAIECKKTTDKVKLERVGTLVDHKIHALLRRIDGGRGMHSMLATKRACKKILEISPDVVHLHNIHGNFMHLPTLLSFLGKHDIPTLVTMHDCWFVSGYCTYYTHYGCDRWLTGCHDCPAVSKRLKKNIEKIYSKKERLYVDMQRLAINGVSKWTTNAAKQSILRYASNIECIYNFIDTELFQPQNNQAETREKYRVASNRKLILGVSQLWTAKKGLDAFLMLADKFSDTADVILVGKCEDIPSKPNLKCIGFTANVNELIDLYSAADVFVNASSADTFGLVTVEAMACGTPVVAFDNTGASELVSVECGILAKDGDYQSLLDGVTEVLDNGKERYSSACRDYVCANFEKNNQLLKYIDFYKRISSK